MCDTAAESFAEAIASSVTVQHQRNTAEVLASHALRTRDLDMNRVNSRYSRYRMTLRSRAIAVKRRWGEAAFVLDVHSFPRDADPYGPYEVVLLDNAATPRSYTLNLRDHLVREANANVEIMRGTNNDIEDEMRAFGIPCVLFEVNESLSVTRRRALATATASWLIARATSSTPSSSSSFGVKIAAGPPPDTAGVVGAALFVLGESIVTGSPAVWYLRAAPEREGFVRICEGETPVCAHVVPLAIAREWVTRGREEEATVAGVSRSSISLCFMCAYPSPASADDDEMGGACHVPT
jgi:hypothetical protein